MLPKENRLPLRTEFLRLKKEGLYCSSQNFNLLYVVEKDEIASPRFAFVVSKKIDKRAVIRNRIRRHLSEAIYPLLPKLKKGTSGIFLVKRSLTERAFPEIKTELGKLFKEAGLL